MIGSCPTQESYLRSYRHLFHVSCPPVCSKFKVRLRGPRSLNLTLVCYHRTFSCVSQALNQNFTNLCLLNVQHRSYYVPFLFQCQALKTKIPGFLGPGYKFVINQQLTLPGLPRISLVAWCLVSKGIGI